jgi:alpha-L-fucosidase
MHRREFCKLVAAGTAGKALRLQAESDSAVGPSALQSYNTLGDDYAEFYAKPSTDRMFYELKNGQFVQEKLNELTWEVSPNSESGPRMPPSLPVPGGSWNGVPMNSPIAGLEGDGPYKATWESLMEYEVPEWYRDAKFGIWAHWSPQCVPEAGDWYARNMYVQGSEQYKYHLQHFGHPSRFGMKDLCPQWSLLNWDPAELIQRYKNAGAKFFLALANHHDNFDAWDSKHNPWNAVAIGPRRDVVGDWAKAARAQGMRFGVTVHQPRNWWWQQTAHSSDTTGPLAGVPYDGHLTAADGKGQWWEGLNPQQLYGPKHPPMALPDISYVKNFYDRTRDLVDQHDPDLLYLDNALLPLGWGGMNASAYFYNHNLKTHGGKMEGVITTKQVPDRLAKALVADIERGVTNGISRYPWQSETCIGDWHYNRGLYQHAGEYGGYQDPKKIIHWLIDTVSKNGTFILNIPGRPDGTIDDKEIAVLDRISTWIKVNGEAIYETRPWAVFGEGPATVVDDSAQGKTIEPGPEDIRFTRNKAGTVVYAIILGWPGKEAVVRTLGLASAHEPSRVEQVELLGYEGKVRFRQTAAALTVQLPEHELSANAIALKVRLG